MESRSSVINIPRNYFDLSQEHVFTMEAGLIYPIYQALLMPGDVIEVSNEMVIRQMPTINPSFSNFVMKTWDFVVAIRNLDKDIYRFMSGFEEYTSEVAWSKPLPKWVPSNLNKTGPGTLWDFLENPINCLPREEDCQLDYFRQAYAYIHDLYFRNETRQKSILENNKPGTWKGEDLLRVNWDRDFLTTSLPNQQLGEPNAIPIQGIGNVEFNLNTIVEGASDTPNAVSWRGVPADNNGADLIGLGIKTGIEVDINELSSEQVLQKVNEVLTKSNTIHFDNAATVLLNQLTQMLAIETMQIIDAIAGIRDDEFLVAHWGERPSNEALQYPELFGKTKTNIITSEVLQTAQNAEGDGVGDMWGHGLGVGVGKAHRYHAKEFCIYLKLAYIKPNTVYGNQGCKREYCQNTKYDFPFPELNHIAMQPIYKKEIVCRSTKYPTNLPSSADYVVGEGKEVSEEYIKQNDEIFGYQPNYTWLTEKLNRVSGLFNQEQYYETMDGKELRYRDNLYNWTEARFFNIDSPIAANDDFLQCKIDNRNYQIIDDSIERCQFMVWHNNKVDAWRSLSSNRLPSTLSVTRGLI